MSADMETPALHEGRIRAGSIHCRVTGWQCQRDSLNAGVTRESSIVLLAPECTQ